MASPSEIHTRWAASSAFVIHRRLETEYQVISRDTREAREHSMAEIIMARFSQPVFNLWYRVQHWSDFLSLNRLYISGYLPTRPGSSDHPIAPETQSIRQNLLRLHDFAMLTLDARPICFERREETRHFTVGPERSPRSAKVALWVRRRPVLQLLWPSLNSRIPPVHLGDIIRPLQQRLENVYGLKTYLNHYYPDHERRVGKPGRDMSVQSHTNFDADWLRDNGTQVAIPWEDWTMDLPLDNTDECNPNVTDGLWSTTRHQACHMATLGENSPGLIRFAASDDTDPLILIIAGSMPEYDANYDPSGHECDLAGILLWELQRVNFPAAFARALLLPAQGQQHRTGRNKVHRH